MYIKYRENNVINYATILIGVICGWWDYGWLFYLFVLQHYLQQECY